MSEGRGSHRPFAATCSARAHAADASPRLPDAVPIARVYHRGWPVGCVQCVSLGLAVVLAARRATRARAHAAAFPTRNPNGFGAALGRARRREGPATLGLLSLLSSARVIPLNPTHKTPRSACYFSTREQQLERRYALPLLGDCVTPTIPTLPSLFGLRVRISHPDDQYDWRDALSTSCLCGRPPTRSSAMWPLRPQGRHRIDQPVADVSATADAGRALRRLHSTLRAHTRTCRWRAAAATCRRGLASRRRLLDHTEEDDGVPPWPGTGGCRRA